MIHMKMTNDANFTHFDVKTNKQAVRILVIEGRNIRNLLKQILKERYKTLIMQDAINIS